MRVLIVDNEKHVIDAIQMLIDWEQYPEFEVYTALDGMDAIALIERHRPHIVLTDMKMPNMHGMQLVEWIRENARTTQIIVISGYNEFEFIQHTLRHGGLDYITKPIDEQQLNKAFAKAIKLVEAEQNTLLQKVQFQKSNLVYWEKLFATVVHAPNNHVSELALLQETFKIATGVQVQLATLQLLPLPEPISSQFSSDMNLLYFSIKNVCQEVLQNQVANAYLFKKEGIGEYIQLFFWGDLSKVERTLKQMLDALNSIFSPCFQIGISDVHVFPDDLEKLDEEAMAAISHRNVLDLNQRIHFYTANTTSEALFFQKEADTLILAIRGRNMNKIDDVLASIFEPIEKKAYISESSIGQLLNEYERLKNYWVRDLLEDSKVDFMFQAADVRKTLGDPPNVKKLRTLIRTDLTQFIQAIHEHESQISNPLFLVKSYVDHHYAEDISLAGLSEIFFLSKEHLSRSFKKTFNQTLSDYLTELRMEKGKILLANEKMTLKEIASLVGYEDEKYFSKVFRQKYGMAPNDYRNKK